MNYFFGINNKIFKSEIQIPIFRNRELKTSELKLFRCYPENNVWSIEETEKNKINDYFYIIKNDEISNKDIFFLADRKIINNYNNLELQKFNTFTETLPAYRSNLKLYLDNGGFSSYQSEYPFSMAIKNGSILNSVNSLANNKADKNYIFVKNIFKDPILEKFSAFIVNYKSKKIEEEYELITNYSNFIEINRKLIHKDNFFFTKKFMGVPIYISTKEKHVSLEHTHPPHEYILSKNKFIKVANLKNEINEIVN
tara:strand:- start:670 stop:1431 length:762 start_codon:yes stop_codon:yes gene_type:complete